MNPPISATGKKPVTETSPARGLATVEMALMLPFLLLTMIGIIDVARAAFVGIAVANAASVPEPSTGPRDPATQRARTSS